MGLGKTMIVAGIGCRKGVDAAEVLAAIDAALSRHELRREDLATLATTAFKKDESGIFAAARALGLDVVVVSGSCAAPTPPSPLWGWGPGGTGGGAERSPSPSRLRRDGEGDNEGLIKNLTPTQRLLTHSPLSLRVAGTPSVSETAALAAAAPGARLLGPRIAVGPVTCALATSGDPA